MFVDLISLMYQLKVAGAKMKTCQEADLESGLQCLNSNTNVCTEFRLVRENRRQLRYTHFCHREISMMSHSKHGQTVCRGEKLKVPFGLSLELGDRFSAPATHQDVHQPAGPQSGKLLTLLVIENYTYLG